MLVVQFVQTSGPAADNGGGRPTPRPEHPLAKLAGKALMYSIQDFLTGKVTVQQLLTDGTAKLVAELTTMLKLQPNESAAATTIATGLLQLAEAEAVNRGLTKGMAQGLAVGLKDLAAKHPTLAQTISTLPEVAALIK